MPDKRVRLFRVFRVFRGLNSYSIDKRWLKTGLLLIMMPFAGIGLMHAQSPVLPDSADREAFQQLRIYQVMVAAFIDGDSSRNFDAGYGPSHHHGDLKGVIRALPYIKNLGMNAVWLTPIFDSSGGGSDDPRLDATGYFPRNYFRIDPRFGSLEDARELVDTAHSLGLYVLFDGVFGHHKGEVPPSPGGHRPVGPAKQVAYPASLAFYQEVATYWIDELGIDGWRLDQAYQVPPEAWQEIRGAVEATCRERRTAGESWGVLGYMVAEIWDGEQAISPQAYGSAETPALYSAFDFPLRYRLVQTLAAEESGMRRLDAATLEEGYRTHGIYPPHAIPNLMLTNHDLVRFGDLIERAGLPGKDHPDYWKRHRCAFSFMAANSGPLTIYYGDEYGEEVPGFAAKVSDRCWEVQRCDDHVSRTSGRIDGFSKEEQSLQAYLRELMQLREAHPALWKGARRNLREEGLIYADEKSVQDERIIYIMNIADETATAEFTVDELNATLLKDLLSGRKWREENGRFRIEMEGLSAAFLLVE